MFTEGDFFRQQRRFTLRHRRDLGFGRTSSENIIQEEIYEIIEEIRISADSNPDNVVDFKSMFNIALINILWAIVGGERFNHNDAQLKRLLHIVELFFSNGQIVRANIPVPQFILRNVPFMRKFVGLRNDTFEPLQDFIRVIIWKWKRKKKFSKPYLFLFQDSITEHENVPSEDAPRDFIDVFLAEMKRQENIDLGSNSTFQSMSV